MEQSESGSRVHLECPVVAFTFSLARCGAGNAAYNGCELVDACARLLDLLHRLIVFRSVDKFALAILADAYARLRALDAAASYALPG